MEPIREMFRQHAWATLTLIDDYMGLPTEQLHEAVPGTYGPILSTVVRLVGADSTASIGSLYEACSSCSTGTQASMRNTGQRGAAVANASGSFGNPSNRSK